MLESAPPPPHHGMPGLHHLEHPTQCQEGHTQEHYVGLWLQPTDIMGSAPLYTPGSRHSARGCGDPTSRASTGDSGGLVTSPEIVWWPLLGHSGECDEVPPLKMPETPEDTPGGAVHHWSDRNVWKARQAPPRVALGRGAWLCLPNCPPASLPGSLGTWPHRPGWAQGRGRLLMLADVLFWPGSRDHLRRSQRGPGTVTCPWVSSLTGLWPGRTLP